MSGMSCNIVGGTAPLSVGRSDDSRSSSSLFDAIVVPAGGQTPEGPPVHVLERLKRAVELYDAASSPSAAAEPNNNKPYVIVTARGTPHKPCPHDNAGFERFEAADNARYLMEHGVDPSRILEESVSLETVGNAFFARIIHTDLRDLRRLAVVNNSFHMPRTKAVFEHVFGVPAATATGQSTMSPKYDLTFFEVENGLPTDALRARLEREAASLPKFAEGGPWRASTPTLSDLHAWVFRENTAYASKRLREERERVDPKVLNSY